MHREALAWVAKNLADLKPTLVIELGSRDVNGSARGFAPGARWHGVDIMPGLGVDEVADLTKPWAAPFFADVVVCTEVLEHVTDTLRVLTNGYEALRPGGALLLTAACEGRAEHSAIDGGPLRSGEYYKNIDPLDLAEGLWPFVATVIEWHRDRGDVYALAMKG